MKEIKYAVIGCGGRISNLIERFSGSDDPQLIGGWDPLEKNTRSLLELLNGGKGKLYESPEELLTDTEPDWIFVGSPNIFHREQICAAFENGKNVFAEKPLATGIEDCLDINKAHKASGKLFATGFTLRYASLYRKAAEILHSGRLGRIVSINADENIPPEHGAYIMRNWRRKKELAGSHVLEKCVHDLDIINWFTRTVPLKVCAFGGNNMFTEENSRLFEEHKEIFDNWPWRKHLAIQFDQGDENPFLSDKTIEDNVVAVMEYGKGIKVQFQATTSNTIPERRMYIHCTEGTMILELYSGMLKYKALGEEAVSHMTFTGGGHGDGDFHIMRELRESMLKGTRPVCGGEEGLRSAVACIAIDNSRIKSEIVDLSALWRDLDVDPLNY